MSAWTRLTVAAGATASTDPVAFIASQNEVDEPLKEFRTAATAAGGDVADPSAIIVTIDDDAQPAVRPADGDRPPPTVRIVADGNVIEGDAASFTLVANPRPDGPVAGRRDVLALDAISPAPGDQGITAGARTVTIPATGSAKLTFVTTDDDWVVDRADGDASDGQRLRPVEHERADVVVVMDDDTSGGNAVGTVSVGASGDTIVEGEDASFTITFDRPPIRSFGGVLPVRVRWSFDGDLADDSARAATFIPGERELEYAFSVGTLDDGSVEAGGSVTLELLPYWDLGYDL